MGGGFDQNVCKTQIKLAITRVKLQKTKKANLVTNQKREIAELLKTGKDESARIKVEGVIREDFIVEAYEILELFCELVMARLGVIHVTKECPPDLREAVCTLIYAAPRTEVKELAAVREQLIAKFGRELALAAVNNKDNCVNARVVHKLSIQTPENYLVFQYLNEIAKAFNLDWKAEFEQQPQIVQDSQISFPEPPSSSVPFVGVATPFFPEPPSTINTTTNLNNSSIPSFPSFPDISKTSTIPSFNIQNMPGVTPNEVTAFQFPNTPTFPNLPNNNTSFPSPTITDFPSTPKDESSKESGIPDFDELTARFEKLKKRDN